MVDLEQYGGATTSSQVGVRFLGLGYYYLSKQEKIKQFYSIWCSRLHNHSLFIKKLHKKLEGPSKFGGFDHLTLYWLHPWTAVWGQVIPPHSWS